MVAHIIAKVVWQGIQPHVGKAAGHVVRGIHSALISGAVPTPTFPATLPGTAAPVPGLPNLATSSLLKKLAVPAAATPAAAAIARHGQAVHRATVKAGTTAGGFGHGVREYATRVGEDLTADVIAQPVVKKATAKIKESRSQAAARAESKGTAPASPTSPRSTKG